jgi:hypothetical protein
MDLPFASLFSRGLLQANENAREQLISTKAVYPNPSINLLALLWDFLGCNSPATEVCAVGTICNLAENEDVRQTPRRLVTRTPLLRAVSAPSSVPRAR